MGGASSRTTLNQAQENILINENTLNDITKIVNENLMSIDVIKRLNCSTSTAVTQDVIFSNVVDSTIGTVNQNQSAIVDSKCLTEQNIYSEAIINTMDKLMSSLEQNNSTNLLQTLDTKLNQATTGASLALAAPPSSDADVTTKITNKTVNTSYKNIQKYLQNVIQNNIKVNDFTDCSKMIQQQQRVIFSGIANSAILGVNQTQETNNISSCIASQNFGSKIAAQLQKDLTNADIVKSDTTTTQQSKADVTQTTTQKDVFEAIGSAISNIIGSVGGIITGVYGTIAMVSSAGVCIILCCCILVIGIMAMMGGGGGEEEGEDCEDEVGTLFKKGEDGYDECMEEKNDTT